MTIKERTKLRQPHNAYNKHAPIRMGRVYYKGWSTQYACECHGYFWDSNFDLPGPIEHTRDASFEWSMKLYGFYKKRGMLKEWDRFYRKWADTRPAKVATREVRINYGCYKPKAVARAQRIR
jgi:hypothetical protein